MIRGEEVNKLRAVIERYFKVYDVRWEYDSAAFFCDLSPDNLEKDFNSLRRDLIIRGYIPMVLYEGGEHIIYVQERAPVKYKSAKLNLAMLLATMGTTIFVGAINWWSYDNKHLNPNDFMQVFTPLALGYGALFFALPLMLILGIHEMGHYLMAKRHGVAASLPFFIPVPVPPLGTFGAFISMREPIPSKKALLDIGVAGPICGFLVAVPVIIIGFKLTDVFAMPVPADAGGLVFLGSSVFYSFLATVFPTGPYLTHPTALAGWVGLLVTFLNLLPAGQLDGGHVARALFGEKARYLSYVSIIIMLGLSIYYQYFGWILFIFIIVFIGVGHPPPLNDITPLDNKRLFTGAVTFLILAGCFTPVPMYPAQINHGGALGIVEHQVNLEPNGTENLTAVVKNLGNIEDGYSLRLELGAAASKDGWWASFNLTRNLTKVHPTVKPNREKNLTFYMRAPANASTGDSVVLNLSLQWKDESGKRHTRTASAVALVGLLKLTLETPVLEILPGRAGPSNFSVQYLGTGNSTLKLDARMPPGWNIDYGQSEFYFTPISGYKASSWFQLEVPANEPVATKVITLRVVTEWVVRQKIESNWTNVTMSANCTSTVSVRVLQAFELSMALDRDMVIVQYGSKAVVNITVKNEGNDKDIITVEVTAMANLSATPAQKELVLNIGESASFDLTIEPLANRTTDMNILVVASSKGDPAAMATRTIEVKVET